MLITLVVLHHIALVYGASSPFYYWEPPTNDLKAYTVLLVFVLFNQTFFMGFFFLISGYFVPRSYDHKGSVSYLKDRLLRLGIPLLVFIFVLNPIASLGIYQMPASLTGITKKLTAASGNFIGNGRWQSAVYTLWDSISSVGMCLGLITVFRRWYNQQGKLRRLMSQQSFTVFIVHIPIVVFLAVLIGGINLENLLKFCLAAIIVVPLCFAVAWLVRKLPGVSKVV